MEWLFPVHGRWLRYLFIGATLGLWACCLYRSIVYWVEARATYLMGPTVNAGNDLRWAHALGVVYVIGFASGLGFLALATRRNWRFAGVFWLLNALGAGWLNLSRPEHVIILFPSPLPLLVMAANGLLWLLVTGIALARWLGARPHVTVRPT